jgi:hypothetical protein
MQRALCTLTWSEVQCNMMGALVGTGSSAGGWMRRWGGSRRIKRGRRFWHGGGSGSAPYLCNTPHIYAAYGCYAYCKGEDDHTSCTHTSCIQSCYVVILFCTAFACATRLALGCWRRFLGASSLGCWRRFRAAGLRLRLGGEAHHQVHQARLRVLVAAGVLLAEVLRFELVATSCQILKTITL